RLSVHQESEIGIRLGQCEQLVPELDQLGAKGLEGRIPFAVPVGVRNDINRRRLVALRHPLIVPDAGPPAHASGALLPGERLRRFPPDQPTPLHFSDPITWTQVSPLSRSIGFPLASR